MFVVCFSFYFFCFVCFLLFCFGLVGTVVVSIIDKEFYRFRFFPTSNHALVLDILTGRIVMLTVSHTQFISHDLRCMHVKYAFLVHRELCESLYVNIYCDGMNQITRQIVCRINWHNDSFRALM